MRHTMMLVIAMAVSISLYTSCNKDETVDPENKVPLVTLVGNPVGSIVTTTIDANGGTLTSADGVLALTVPAGAEVRPLCSVFRH